MNLDLDLHGDLQPDCLADRPVTGPRQSSKATAIVIRQLHLVVATGKVQLHLGGR